MKRAGTIIVSMLLAIGLAGCAESSTTSSAKPSGTTAQPAAVKDNLTACKTLLGDDMKILTDMPSLLTGIASNATQDQQDQLKQDHLKIMEASKSAETDLAGHLASLDAPFKQAYDVMESGGGALSMDTSHVAGDVTNIMADCVKAGYKASNPAAVPSASATPSVPADYTSALTSAEQYASAMHMSRQGIYDQLTSQYGDKFSPEAAQYAVDNLKADYNANALASAKQYQSQMSMSPAAIHDQLTSQYGDKFTPQEADYAIQHLND